MSEIHVQQIRGYLQKEVAPHIDSSDVAAAPKDQIEKCVLTRALASLAIMHLCDVEAPKAASTVTDGTGDNGVDALYFDDKEKTLYVVQSKWKSDGHGSLELGEARAVIAGFRDLISNQLDRFNEKVRKKAPEIQKALFDSQARFVLVLIYTGQEPLADEVSRQFSDILEEMNDTSQILSLTIFRQRDIHRVVSRGGRLEPINIDVGLYEWGHVTQPYVAYYGQVAASEVASWYQQFHPHLFAPNLRLFLGDTEVNEGMSTTISDSPERFWYFNNGITALCGAINKKPVHGNNRAVGVFECQGFSIVNGAQTVGAIAAASLLNAEAINRARVSIRLISLQQCPEDFPTAVTRATNTQNRIERRDFVSQDEEQERLRAELAMEGITYAIKSGEKVATRDVAFDLVEATIAVACAAPDIGMAVHAKREISKLWEDITKAPYRALFNPRLSGRRLWRLVKINRVIEDTLDRIQREKTGREQLTVIHGNRFISHECMKLLPLSDIDRDDCDLNGILQRAVEVAQERAAVVITRVSSGFYDSYPAALFKNNQKCKDLSGRISQVAQAAQGKLF